MNSSRLQRDDSANNLLSLTFIDDISAIAGSRPAPAEKRNDQDCPLLSHLLSNHKSGVPD
jgi:hypothetical protein